MNKKLKKAVFSLFLFAILTSFISVPSYAATSSDNFTDVQVEDFGNYIIKTIIMKQNPYSRSNSISAVKGKQIEDKKGNVLCQFFIEATFSVNQGSSATCTYKNAYGKSISSYWKVEDISSKYINNIAAQIGGAEASGVFQKRIIGIPVESHNVTVTIQCDRFGNIF